MANQYPSAPDLVIDLDKTYTATIDTNHGVIEIEFDAVRSPHCGEQLRASSAVRATTTGSSSIGSSRTS